MFRNINQLGDWIDPSYELIAQLQTFHKSHTVDFKLLKTTVSVLNAVFDDIYCIAKMRALYSTKKKPWIHGYADMQANRAWFAGTLLSLYGEHNNLVQQNIQWETTLDRIEQEKLARERWFSLVNTMKLFCDLAFVCKFFQDMSLCLF